MSTIAVVMEEALALAPEDQSYLAQKLIASLDESPAQQLSIEWEQEIESRIARLSNGDTRTYSQEEVHQEVEGLFRK